MKASQENIGEVTVSEYVVSLQVVILNADLEAEMITSTFCSQIEVGSSARKRPWRRCIKHCWRNTGHFKPTLTMQSRRKKMRWRRPDKHNEMLIVGDQITEGTT